jgi:hypothetical protein
LDPTSFPCKTGHPRDVTFIHFSFISCLRVKSANIGFPAEPTLIGFLIESSISAVLYREVHVRHLRGTDSNCQTGFQSDVFWVLVCSQADKDHYVIPVESKDKITETMYANVATFGGQLREERSSERIHVRVSKKECIHKTCPFLRKKGGRPPGPVIHRTASCPEKECFATISPSQWGCHGWLFITNMI